jgi:hypothetical protein
MKKAAERRKYWSITAFGTSKYPRRRETTNTALQM